MRCGILAAVCLLMLSGVASGATLDWIDNANNEKGFEIERASVACAAGIAFVKIGEVGENAQTYTDGTTAQGYRYCYRVRAWNFQYADDSGLKQYSEYSNLAGIGYPLVAPTAPSGLGAQP